MEPEIEKNIGADHAGTSDEVKKTETSINDNAAEGQEDFFLDEEEPLKEDGTSWSEAANKEAPAEENTAVKEEKPVEEEVPAKEETPAEEETPANGKAPTETEIPVSEEPPVNEEPPQKKSHKGLVIGGIALLAAIGGCAGAYVYKAQDYNQRFIPNTTINGIDASDLTVEEVEELIKKKAEDYVINITFPQDTRQFITAQDMGLTYESDGSVQKLLEEQNPYLWGEKFLGKTHENEINENCSHDSAKLLAALEALPEFEEGNYEVSTNAAMVLGEDYQYTIVPEIYGTELNKDSVMEKLADAIELRAEDVAFDDSYYIAPEIYSDNEELNADIENNNKLLKSKITYTLHDKKTYEIGAEELITWLAEKEGEPNHYYINDEILAAKAQEAAAALAAAEDCSYNTIEFKTTNRGTRSIHTGSYGCTVDQEKEAAQIVEDLKSGQAVERTPNYSKEYKYPLGGTYAEVDITNQKVYMYKNGTLIVSSSCVTGTDSEPSRRTDRGFFHVARRNTNYTMRGRIDPATGKPEYESFVNYAVFYNGGEALHDASWRSSFGGSIYKNNGSHGCVNLPYSAAQKIYNNSYVGMPVIVY